jgi:hypothetical protein
MAFELVVGIGRRNAVGGPIVRMNGRFDDVPAGATGVNLMITDCTTVRRIKRLNLGAGGDAAFSLGQADLAGPCAGLNPAADWYVYGQVPGTPPRTSLGIKFPATELGHDSESHDIPRLKRAVIARLKDKIKSNKRSIAALDAMAQAASAFAASAFGVGWAGQKAAELADAAADEMAELEGENEATQREIDRREAQFERQFGGR